MKEFTHFGEIKIIYHFFYGGVPNKISQHLNLYKFEQNDEISDIKINFKNGTNYTIDLNNINNTIEFSELQETICLPSKILYQFKNIFMNKFKKYNNYYMLNDEQKNLFPDIELKIGNKKIILNTKNFFMNIITYF